MARPLHFNKPTHSELRQLLHWLESITDPIIRQRIEVILALGTLTFATEVAHLFNLHLNTVLYYVHCFNRRRLHWVTARRKGGPHRKIPKRVERQIVAIAQRPPAAFGLIYGTWSLARLQWFVTKKRKLLRRISREHLRRLLKKTVSIYVGSSAKSTAKTHVAEPFSLVLLGPSGPSRPMPSSCSWTRKDR